MGCCPEANVQLQKTRAKFSKPPETLPDGAIKLSRPAASIGNLVGYVADQSDPTILRPEHPPCSHFMSQAFLERDGALSVFTLCMNPNCAFHAKMPLPTDCSECPTRQAPKKRSAKGKESA